MVKGFIRLTGKYSGDPIYIQAREIKAVLPLKSLVNFDRTTEGSAIYTKGEVVLEGNYFCVLESAESVMTLMEMAEMAAENE